MRKIILIIIVLLPITSFCQELSNIQSQVDSLESINAQLKKNIDLNTKLIFQLKDKYNQIKASKENITPFYFTVTEKVKISKEQDLFSKALCSVEKGDSVKIINFDSDYYVINYKDITGFINHYSLPLNPTLNHFKETVLLNQLNNEKTPEGKIKILDQLKLFNRLKNEAKNDSIFTAKARQESEIEKIEEQKENERNVKEAQIRKVALIKKYGQANGQRITDGKIWIGMTSKMAKESWGEPDDINRTVNQYNTHEQWVYGSNYLYFENGILTSWQD